MTSEERKQTAMNYFTEGYNCAQSLVLTFSDLLPIHDKDALTALASSFGGGMGRLREVCGALTGAFAVLGLLYGYSTPETGERKAEHYARIQAFAKEFEEQSGSLLCRDLLGLSVQHDSPVPSARTETYYQERPCKNLIGMSAQLLETYIESHPIPTVGKETQ